MKITTGEFAYYMFAVVYVAGLFVTIVSVENNHLGTGQIPLYMIGSFSFALLNAGAVWLTETKPTHTERRIMAMLVQFRPFNVWSRFRRNWIIITYFLVAAVLLLLVDLSGPQPDYGFGIALMVWVTLGTIGLLVKIINSEPNTEDERYFPTDRD